MCVSRFVYSTGECSGCDVCVCAGVCTLQVSVAGVTCVCAGVCTLQVSVAGVTCVCAGVYTTGECSGCDVCVQVCTLQVSVEVCVHYR